MYGKDISRKVKSAKWLRMHKGYYISCQPPYGYKVNPNDTNQLVIDEEVVDIVKLIFRLALNSNGVVKIVQELNKRGIDTPSIYKAKNGDKRCLTSIEQRKSGRRAYSYQCYDRYWKHPTDTEANSIRYEVIYQIVEGKKTRDIRIVYKFLS